MPRSQTIRRSLLINLVVIVVLLGGLIVAATQLSGQRGIRIVSRSLIRQTLGRVTEHLDKHFQPVARNLQVFRESLESGLVMVDDSQVFRSWSSTRIRHFPWMTGVSVGDERGRGAAVVRDGSRWLHREFRRDEWGDRNRVWEWSDDDPEPLEREERTEFDPRERPWFQGAAEVQEGSAVFWTEPYFFFTLQIPGLTASVPVSFPDGSRGVAALDVTLEQISRFTNQIRIKDHGVAFVLSEDGRIVGIPFEATAENEEWMRERLLKRPDEGGLQLGVDASRALLSGPEISSVPVRFLSGGEAWWGQVEPYDLPGSDHRLLAGVALLEADFLGEVRRQRILVLLLILLFVLIAIARAVALARRYSLPIEALVKESNRIGEGDLAPGEPIASPLEEVQQLASAHDRMREGLRKLLKVEQELQVARKIQQGTFPTNLPVVPGYEIEAWSEPADETGGDTYDVIGVRRGADGRIELTTEEAEQVVFLLADATGHGIGPALSVTQARAMLRMAVRLSAGPQEIVTNINEQLVADLPSNRFITAWLAVLDPQLNTLTGLSAAQAPLLHYHRADDRCEVLDADTLPLGVFGGLEVKIPEPRSLGKGDVFAVISDGIFEALAPDGDEEFGVDRTVEVIRQFQERSLEELLVGLRSAVDAFTEGAPAHDDRTVILCRRC